MDIQCESGLTIYDVNETQLRDAFADDKARGAFIILSISSDTYIQSSNDKNGVFDLEYRDPRCTGDNVRAVGTYDKAAILDAFLKYYNKDKTWRNDFTWEPRADKYGPPKKPWWKFW